MHVKTDLTDDELETYARQIVLTDIGYEGQLRLRNASVCLVGLGGLGSPAALTLTGMGVGRLRLVDRVIMHFRLIIASSNRKGFSGPEVC